MTQLQFVFVFSILSIEVRVSYFRRPDGQKIENCNSASWKEKPAFSFFAFDEKFPLYLFQTCTARSSKFNFDFRVLETLPHPTNTMPDDRSLTLYHVVEPFAFAFRFPGFITTQYSTVWLSIPVAALKRPFRHRFEKKIRIFAT